MKNKFVTALSCAMIFIPWSILPLRSFDWALKSPTAEIMIASYALFMIFSGVFTIVSYFKSKLQSNIMKICLLVNGLYLIGGLAAPAMMIAGKF